MSNFLRLFPARAFLAVLIGFSALSPGLAVGANAVKQQDLHIVADDGRIVQTRIFAPASGCENCALVIFSHGAFSTYDRYDQLLLAWAEAGFVVAAPMHVDSEAHPERENYGQDEALPTRVEDYVVLREWLTQSARLQAMEVSLSGEIIAAGHSFGALIAQIAGGANPPTVASEALSTLARQPPVAVVAISPPPAIDGYIEFSHWSRITVPMLVVTGTADVIPDFVPDWKMHLLSYEAASEDSTYALVFDDVDHYFNGAFGRLTPEAGHMEKVVGLLNQSIIGFIRAAQDGVSPTETSWWKTMPDSVRRLAHGETLGDE